MLAALYPAVSVNIAINHEARHPKQIAPVSK